MAEGGVVAPARHESLTAAVPPANAAFVTGEALYAMSGDAFIAYEVVGEGNLDLLVIVDGFIPIDTMDDEPRFARSMSRLNSFARLIRFDRRGVGLSDPVSPASPPTLEQWVEDAIAVLDAAGSERAVVVASAEMSSVGMLIAATHPDRVESLVLVNSFARAMADTDYPEGLDPTMLRELIGSSTDPVAPDGPDDFVFVAAPSAAHDPHFRQWWKETGRRGASPATARALLRVELESDVRAALPTIQCPTLVVHMRDEPLIPMALGRYVADHVPGARWVEVAGADDLWWVSDAAEKVLDAIEEFVTGVPSTPTTNRCCRPCSSPTSSRRPNGRTSSATVGGARCSTTTIARSVANWTASGGARSTRPATGSSRRSTVRPGPWVARARSATRRTSSASRSAAASIPARSSSATTTSQVSRCTSPRASRPWPNLRPYWVLNRH